MTYEEKARIDASPEVDTERDTVWENSYEDTEHDWKAEAEHWKALYNNLVGALNTINHAGGAV